MFGKGGTFSLVGEREETPSPGKVLGATVQARG